MLGIPDTIDHYIKLVRKLFGIFANSSNNGNQFENKLKKFLGIKNLKEYNFIIDSFCLFEDTQEAKKNFKMYGIEGRTKNNDIDECYLRIYGLLNACFLQKEALTVYFSKLNINYDEKKFKESEMMIFRNIYGAHTPNKKQWKER